MRVRRASGLAELGHWVRPDGDGYTEAGPVTAGLGKERGNLNMAFRLFERGARQPPQVDGYLLNRRSRSEARG